VIKLSYTSVYSECLTKEGKNPIITNLQKLKKTIKNGFGDWFANNFEMGSIRKHKTLIGFRSWEKDVVRLPNIKSFGWRYTLTDEWAKLFALCSKFTQPFVVYHSPMQLRFPSLLDFYKDKTCGFIFQAKCQNGTCNITKIAFGKPKIDKQWKVKC
jgi:hypothetical protein